MSDEDPTSAGTPAHDSRRVEAYRPPDPADAPIDGTRVMEAAPPDTSQPSPTPMRSSTEMASQSQKERRRERDRRAEKAAQRALLISFLGIGAVGIWLVNSGIFDDAPRASPTPGASASAQAVPTPSPSRTLSAAPDETPDLQALRSLKTTGLTIAAEGLPEVLAIDPPNPPALLAGIETCRMAYAVWELSPNRAFRFLTTCAAFQKQVLVGAYEIRGSKVFMSPLRADGAELTMVFEVEKPSRMITTVKHSHKGQTVVMEARQNITAIRPGMDGDSFFHTYAPRNNIEIAGVARSKDNGGDIPPDPQQAPPPPQPKQPESDPVLDLLKGE